MNLIQVCSSSVAAQQHTLQLNGFIPEAFGNWVSKPALRATASEPETNQCRIRVCEKVNSTVISYQHKGNPTTSQMSAYATCSQMLGTDHCSIVLVLLLILHLQVLDQITNSCSYCWRSEGGNLGFWCCFLFSGVCRPFVFELVLDWVHWRTYSRGQPFPTQMCHLGTVLWQAAGLWGGNSEVKVEGYILNGSCLTWRKRIRATHKKGIV